MTGAEVIVGIDLGTTNSGVAVWDGGRPVMLADDAGRDLTPSLVGWDPDAAAWRVGHEAAELRRRHPRRVAASVKRLIGREFDHPAARFGRDELAVPLLPGAGAVEGVRLDLAAPRPDWLPPTDRPGLSVPEASAFVLRRLRDVAAVRLGREVRKAVVTVPAYFDHNQRTATRLAGKLAGLDVVDILNEPTAAALAYGNEVLVGDRRLLLVFDLGGGTFDVSLLEAERDEVGYQFTTRVIDGDTRLGGDDVDVRLAELIRSRSGSAADDPAARDRRRVAAEAAKQALTDADSAEAGGVVLTRADVEAASAEVRARAAAITRRVVEEVAGVGWAAVDEVILVGGQTLTPAVQAEVAALAGRPPRAGDRPQLAVALGAASYAHWLARGREKFHENALTNVIALPLGLRLNEDDFRPLVPANATLPYDAAPFAVTTTQDNQDQIEVEILQGPRGANRASQCLRLGSLVMEVPPAPARVPKFDVRFHVRADATLRVEVADARRPDRVEAVDITEGRITVRAKP